MSPKVALALIKYAIQSNEFNIGNWIRFDYRRSIGVVLLLIYSIVFGCLVSQSYFTVDALTCLGIVLFPYILIIRQKSIYNYRYSIVLIVLLFLSFWVPARSLHFGLLTIGILFIVEFTLGKINLLPILLIGVLSPFFRYTSIIFSFPIRLQLSEWAGAILSACGFANTIYGNVIQVGDTEFMVDVACMGLQMTETALLMTIFLIAYNERKTQQKLNNLWLIVLAISTLMLNSISNLFRILLLIVFHILPQNPMHDAIGLACLLLYVIVPMGFIIRWLYQKKGNSISDSFAQKKNLIQKSGIQRSGILSVALLVIILLVMGMQLIFQSTKPIDNQAHSPISLSGFTQQKTTDGITQYTSPTMLVYIKPITSFYVAEHSPLICWRGSGYTFKRVEMQTIQNTTIYTGILQKGKNLIYTAWWFDNGSHRATNQMDWRWRMMRGEKRFYLVNVNVNKPKDLREAVEWMFRQQVVQQ